MDVPSYNSAEIAQRLKNDLRVYSSLTSILDKATQDGYVKLLTDSIHEIFKRETVFAIRGKLSRAEEIA